MPRSLYQRIEQPVDAGLAKLLGPLELAVMELMWERDAATVRDIVTALQPGRPLAHTTVMTIMTHLVDKGLLRRTPLDRRTHLYEVVLSRDQFLQDASARVVRALVEDFGDLALAQFARALEDVSPAQQQRIRRLLKEHMARIRQQEATVDEC